MRAICFHDLSLSDTYDHCSCFRHYVLFPPISFRQIVHCKAKCFPLCQCCLQRVALADTKCTADFLGDDNAAKIVNPSDNASCFHRCFLQYSLCVQRFYHCIPYSLQQKGKYSLPDEMQEETAKTVLHSAHLTASHRARREKMNCTWPIPV